MRWLVLAALVALTRPAAADESAPAFPFTADEFQRKLNAAIVADSTDKDHADTLRQCRKRPGEVECSFKDMAFQKTIAGFKRLDLASGRFTLNMSLKLSTNRDGRVTRILLIGDRSDFANLMETLSVVANIAQTFDPDAVSGSVKTFADELGIIRGDDAKDIGKPRTVIKPYAVIGCLSMPSDETTRIGCTFTPRS